MGEQIFDFAMDGAIVRSMLVDEPAGVPEKGVAQQNEQAERHTRQMKNRQWEMKEAEVDDRCEEKRMNQMEQKDEEKEEILDENQQTEEVEGNRQDARRSIRTQEIIEENRFVVAGDLRIEQIKIVF